MYRLLLSLVLIAMLALGQMAESLSATAGVEMDGPVVAALAHGTTGPLDQPSGQRTLPTYGCHHLSCSQGNLAQVAVLVSRPNFGSSAVRPVSEHDRRSFILDRDPPVPRPLA